LLEEAQPCRERQTCLNTSLIVAAKENPGQVAVNSNCRKIQTYGTGVSSAAGVQRLSNPAKAVVAVFQA
jgi:hypothetical protein